MRPAGTWSWVVGRVLADGWKARWESYAQPLSVLTLSPRTTEARPGLTETAHREAVVVVISHLSNAACANAHCFKMENSW